MRKISARVILLAGCILLLTMLNLGFARRQTAQSPWILFYSKGGDRQGFFRVRPDGSDLRALHNIPEQAEEIRISPDGRWMMVVSGQRGRWEIYRMRLDGSAFERLSDYLYTTYMPEWSADGRRIAYLGWDYERMHLFVMDADGSDVREIPGAWGIGLMSVRWSPDSQSLLIEQYQSSTRDLFRLDSDGRQMQELFVSNSRDHAADWSPDGASIVFASDRDSAQERLYRLTVETQHVERIGDLDGQFFDVRHSPDGAWLAFSFSAGRGGSIFRMAADGTSVQRLTDLLHDDSAPQWFPIIDYPLREWLLILTGLALMGVGLRGSFSLSR